MLIIDGVRYNLWTPKNEKEFEDMVKERSKEIFGENSVYFDLKHRLASKSGLVSIPDGYVISFSRPFEWYIVEGELSSHPLHEHITNQLNKFVTGIKNPSAQKELVEKLYEEIAKDRLLRAYVENKIVSQEITRFLYDLISKPPKTVVVIEEKGDEVQEACGGLKVEPTVVEFRTYVRENAENVRAHLFEPIHLMKKEVKEERRPLPEHYRNWDSILSWVEDSVRVVVKALSSSTIELGGVTHAKHGRYYCFYRGKPSTKSIFVAFLLTKNALKVRIRTDPETFRDPKKWTGERVYKGWFFKKGEEREFKIVGIDQMDYAMELVKQSYELAK